MASDFVFPTETLPAQEGQTAESLPAEEGIHGQGEEEETESAEAPPETERQYETDEYIPVEEGEVYDSGVPDAVPGSQPLPSENAGGESRPASSEAEESI